MSDDLDIRGGGVVSVDTDTLRTAAAGFAQLSQELDEIARLAFSAAGQLGLVSGVNPHLAQNVSGELADAAVRAGSYDRQLLIAAEVYELAELRAQRAAAVAVADAAAIVRIDAQLAALDPDSADSALETDRSIAGWGLGWPSELTRQALMGPWALFPGAGLVAASALYSTVQGLQTLGWGRVAADAKLRDVHDRARIGVVARTTATTAPTSLAAAADRIPGGDQTRIRVEKYTMPDGTRQFAVYVAGTQKAGAAGQEPFDMQSNVELYSGASSASYDATREALRASGAQPGDVVHAFGHSQGAMITSHLALEGEYDTRTLVSFGNPIAPEVGDGTLAVSVRHTDDPVAALQGGGYPQAVGAPGSFIAERAADPVSGVHDLTVPGHVMTAYSETATMLDASSDPRMRPVRAMLDELGSAVAVETVEYSAERILPGQQQPDWVSGVSASGGGERGR